MDYVRGGGRAGDPALRARHPTDFGEAWGLLQTTDSKGLKWRLGFGEAFHRKPSLFSRTEHVSNINSSPCMVTAFLRLLLSPHTPGCACSVWCTAFQQPSPGATAPGEDSEVESPPTH